MKRMRRLLIVLLIVVASLIATRYFLHRRDRALALPVIAELGGDVATIPYEPLGTEYRITFRALKLTQDDLDRLVVINPLASRNWVGIIFLDSGLTADDVCYVQEILPNVHVLPAEGAD